MSAAEKFIGNGVTEQRRVRGNDIADHNRVTFVNDNAIHQPGIKRGPTSAPTSRFNVQLDTFVGELQQALRPGKEQTAKVRDEPEGVNVGVETVGDDCELVGLIDGVELTFVAHDVVEGTVVLHKPFCDALYVEVRCDLKRILGKAEAAGDPCAFAIELREQQAPLASLRKVVMNLER